MAKFKMELPDDIMKDIKKLYDNYEEIFGGMTREGAEVALRNIKANAPNSAIAQNVHLSVTYKTPSDDGISTKVYFSGYLPFRNGQKSFSRKAKGKLYTTTKGIPIPFLVNMYEYGRRGRRFPKKPFFRRAFKKGEIESAMLNAQKRLSGGLLDE